MHDGKRIFYCSDYTVDRSACVFNWDAFLLDLASQRYLNFKKQFLIADVCSTETKLPVQLVAGDNSNKMRRVDQVCYYATIDNEYANADTEAGEFSRLWK